MANNNIKSYDKIPDMNSKKNKNLKIKLKNLTLPVILFIQFVTIVGLIIYAHFVQQQLDRLSSADFGNKIIFAVDHLNKNVNVEPQTGKIYISEAKLVLPPQPYSTHTLQYSYTYADIDQPEELSLIDTFYVDIAKQPIYNAQNTEQLFKAVPKLQACARGYQVAFSERKELGMPEVLQKQLNDGRTVHIYAEEKCPDSKDVMLPYLQQIQSY